MTRPGTAGAQRQLFSLAPDSRSPRCVRRNTVRVRRQAAIAACLVAGPRHEDFDLRDLGSAWFREPERILSFVQEDVRLHHDTGTKRAGRSRSEEQTSELQSLMRISYAVFCLKKKKTNNS